MSDLQARIDGKLVTDYPFIVLWEQNVMHCRHSWYVESQVDAARKDNAPSDAIFKTGTWHTLETCENAKAFAQMGLPIPRRLWYSSKITVFAKFETAKQQCDFEDLVTQFLQKNGVNPQPWLASQLTTPGYFITRENYPEGNL